jgi:adenylyl- and sulfurtransferase ThiI
MVSVGLKVEALFDDDIHWYSAVVTRDNGNQTFAIRCRRLYYHFQLQKEHACKLCHECSTLLVLSFILNTRSQSSHLHHH